MGGRENEVTVPFWEVNICLSPDIGIIVTQPIIDEIAAPCLTGEGHEK